MKTEEFAEYLEGKTLEEIVHKARKESEKRMLAQGIPPIATFLSEIMLEAFETFKFRQYILPPYYSRHVRNI